MWKVTTLQVPSGTDAVINSFPEHYQKLIKMLPDIFQPENAKHGAHSYTKCLVSSSVQFYDQPIGVAYMSFPICSFAQPPHQQLKLT